MTHTYILIADADAGVRDIVRLSCQDRGWAVREARDGVAAIKLLRRSRYSLLVMESELPVISGLMVLESLKPLERAPTIFISRKSSENDRLAAFEAGGNDFVPKPFYPRELMARIQNILNLTERAWQMETISAGGIVVEPRAQAAFVDGRPIRLSPREFGLLTFLCRNPNRAFTRNQLLDSVWGSQYDGVDRTVDTHIKTLREKIQPYQKYIETLWGYGYKFSAPDDERGQESKLRATGFGNPGERLAPRGFTSRGA
jgi:DNA-binding response OmpR family regulator